MQNISIPDIIANLKGRRGYEEKKAKKLGYDCLEKYFEDNFNITILHPPPSPAQYE